MAENPVAGIYAPVAAHRDFLAEVVRMAGFSLSISNDWNIDAGWRVAITTDGAMARRWRTEKSELPVLLIGAQDSALENIQQLPPPVKAARLLEMLRKTLQKDAWTPAKMALAGCVLDTRENLFIRADGEALRLTEKETEILICLVSASPASMSREEMLARVWAYVQGVETHTLETHIYRLRQKIEINPSKPAILLTSEDGGYVLGKG